MYVRRWIERPFGSDEPHIGGYQESELISEPEEVENLFLDEWYESGYCVDSVQAVDDYDDEMIELEAQYFFRIDFRNTLDLVLEELGEDYSRTRFDSAVAAVEQSINRQLKRKKYEP